MFITLNDGKESELPTSSSHIQWSQSSRKFDFEEILLATQNFDESLVIGRGGFGKVYKGNINLNTSSSFVAAIKRLDSMSNQGASEFWTEIEMLSKLQHCHLVSLIGYCHHEKEMILVYEYMSNGTLEDHLHKYGTPLSWLQRLKIIIGASRGLHYLHTGTGIEFGVIHRDVKSSNILLHDSWAAKVSDFGLSRIGPTNQPLTYVNTLVKGTFGYLDPNYFTTGRLTRKSDVYAFGVVLLEVLCRKRAVDKSLDDDQWGLAAWAQDFIKLGKLKHIVDPELRGQIAPKCLKEFVRIVERCLQYNPKQRPTMAEVVVSLESLQSAQEKMNNSLQVARKTIFGRMLENFLLTTSNQRNSVYGDSMLPIVTSGNKRDKSNTNDADNNRTTVDGREVCRDSGITANNPSTKVVVFNFADLESATRRFSQNLGLGGCHFGELFLGWIDKESFAPSTSDEGMAVVLKRSLLKKSQNPDQHQATLSMLKDLDHPNILNLLGYCHHEDKEFLIYEYMVNRTLDVFLFTNADDISKPLSWGTRLRILIGVARGLTYLHSSKGDQVVCGGVQTSNILLDQDFNAKLIDFGLQKSSLEFGQTSYISLIVGCHVRDPEYMRTGHFNMKSDIYGFGVVLLETLTALPAISVNKHDEEYSLVDWVQQILANKRHLKEIMDPRLEENYPLQGAFECGKLALKCVANKPKDRPSSEEVLQNLERIYAVSLIWKDRLKDMTSDPIS